jgi:hypothetical protein
MIGLSVGSLIRNRSWKNLEAVHRAWLALGAQSADIPNFHI